LKKLFLALILSFIAFSLNAQTTEKPQLFKYVSTAPDGTVVFTVIDDSRKSDMTIESQEDFYKYQLVDLKTGKIIVTARNIGKTGTIDKSKLAAGEYNLLVYTKSFIIGSEITVNSAKTTTGALAMTEVDEN